MSDDDGFKSCYMTGIDLLDELQTSEEQEDFAVFRSHAYGYIAAVVDAHTLFHRAENFPAVFDFPQGEFGTVATLIANELAEEPELLDGTAASLIVRILRRHFPSMERSRG